ncbi:MAG TPA: DUF255 domain-containing protein [Gemmatimonadaceae bacterium]|nr:DUF255 domain-containing protein [Gemmatimonadaceae bacterium]
MSIIPWFTNDTVGDALQEARALARPIFLDLWSRTCKGCAKLFAVGYQANEVRQFLAERFICIKYDTKAPNEWFRKLNGSVGHVWHPDLVVLDDRLTEAKRVIGYLPPRDLIAHLSLGIGLVHLHRTRYDQALETFEEVSDRYGDTTAAAEALYWEGVAALRAGGGLAALSIRWEALRAAHPSSQWALAADCLDVSIPDGGFDSHDLGSVRLGDSLACC